MGMWQKQKDYHHLVCLFELKIHEKLKPKFDCTMNISQVGAGFPTGVEKMRGGSSKFDGGLSQYMGEAWGGGVGGWGLKILLKIPVVEFIWQ